MHMFMAIRSLVSGKLSDQAHRFCRKRPGPGKLATICYGRVVCMAEHVLEETSTSAAIVPDNQQCT